MGCGRHKKDRLRKKESKASVASCCLNCRSCASVADWYGETLYRCAQTARIMGSSAALLESCGRFERGR